MDCIKCRKIDNEPSLNCDSCERSIHSDCSGLNASELKVMALKGKRTLRFMCEECMLGVRLVPKLIKKIDDLQAEIDKLKTLIQTTPQIPLSQDDFVAELQEREKRKKNVMIFNMPEPPNEANELSKVKEIISKLTNEELNFVKVFRIGKPNKNGNRALKVIFNNAEDANKVIRANKDVLRGKGIFVNADQTRLQMNSWRKLKDELEEKKKAGENVTIRYFNGVPKIIKQSQKN